MLLSNTWVRKKICHGPKFFFKLDYVPLELTKAEAQVGSISISILRYVSSSNSRFHALSPCYGLLKGLQFYSKSSKGTVIIE